MKAITCLVAIAGGLVLVVVTNPSWGQTGVNPTASDASFNTAGGTVALGTCLGNAGAECSSLRNTAFGFGALRFNTAGHDNTATGAAALLNNTTGSNNSATGDEALFNNNGIDNTASGYTALRSNTTGGANVATGAFALRSNTA